jgi:hypothetical protein
MNIRIVKYSAFPGFVAMCIALIITASAHAEELKIKLTGTEETPPVVTSSSGTAKIRIGADKTVTGKVETSGIEGIAAHIHVGAPGQAGPPIITLVKAENGEWTIPPGSKLTDDQFASFKAGNLYINVHSAEHKPGEIRGQLKP